MGGSGTYPSSLQPVQTIPASGYLDPQTLGPQCNSTQPLYQSSLLSLFKCHLLWEGSLDYPLQCSLQNPVWVPLTGLWCPSTLRGCLHFPWLVILVQGGFDAAACYVTLCISVSGPQQHLLHCGDAKTYLLSRRSKPDPSFPLCSGALEPD